MLPLWAVFACIILTLFFAAEFGFYTGRLNEAKLSNARSEDKQAGSIMGASLALLGFLLAFTFGMASSIHTERKELVLEESNAIGTLYLRSQMLENPKAEQIRSLLREYVDLRIQAASTKSNQELSIAIKTSEDILEKLWPLTTSSVQQSGITAISAMIISSANEVIDLHTNRINAAHKRLPEIISITVMIIAIITLGLMGYQSGLNGVRVLIPRTAMITSLATVMLLVVDLDRPGGNLIEVSQQTMVDLQHQINK